MRLWLFSIVSCCFGVRYVYKLPIAPSGRVIDDDWDYVVVGGGGVGSIVARTLSDAGKKVLVIERGDIPYHSALGTKGLRNALLKQSQVIVTDEGIRSHVGAVLGGGTSINFGIWIEETAQYFAEIERASGNTGAFANWPEFEEAFQWARAQVASPPPNDSPGVLSQYLQLSEAVVRPQFARFRGPQPALELDTTWSAYSLFGEDTDDDTPALGRPRRSAAALVDEARGPLTVLLNSTVLRIESAPGEPKTVLRCVAFRPTEPDIDLRPIGQVDWQLFGGTARADARGSSFNVRLKQQGMGRGFPPRVCVKAGTGRVILSAGAIHSPLILLRSGVQPERDVQPAGRGAYQPVARNDGVGVGLKDRPLMGVSFFLKPGAMYGTVHGTTESTETMICNTAGLTSDGFAYEEMLGGTSVQAALVGSRLLLPPWLRNSVLGDAIGNTLEVCMRGGWHSSASPLCPIAATWKPCLSKNVAWWTFLTNVTSSGAVYLHKQPSGFPSPFRGPFDDSPLARGPFVSDAYEPRVRGGYFATEADKAAIRNNLRRLLMMAVVHTDNLADIFVTEDECPMRIFNDPITITQTAQSVVSWMSQRPRPNSASRIRVQTMSSLPFSTFPQKLPDPINYNETEFDEFVRAYASSMWHFVGSLAVGRALNGDFSVRKVQQAYVIDGSVVPHLTRMNPTATLMAIGRVAALRLLRADQQPTDQRWTGQRWN